MRNGRIKYFSILGVVLFLYLTTSVYSLLICTYILLILPILSLVISLPGMRHVDVEKTHEHFIAKRNHLAYLHFKRVPYKYYPSALIKIDYEYIQTICNQKNSYKVYMEDEQTDIILLRNHVGHCDLTITRFRCYDLLGLFYHTTRCQKKCSMYIEPNLIDIEQEVKKLEVFVDDSELYSPYRYGNDYSELYEIRQYRQGDSLKYINWKSTLQRQDIYVNIGSQSIVKNVLVTILITDDFNENDIAYDYFHSLCHKMLNQEIDFDNLVMLNDSLSSRTIKMESEGKYIVTYCNNGQQYISIKETNDEDAEKLFSIQDLKKMYGKGFHHFYGNELSYVIETKNKDIFVSKEFFDRMKVDCTECRVLYDPEKKIIYFTPQETFSDLSGEVIDPIKETPVNVVTEEATDMEMIQALLTEFTNFKESADKLFTKYRDMEKGFSELKAENEAIKKALKEQNQTVTINNGKAYFESFEEMTL